MNIKFVFGTFTWLVVQTTTARQLVLFAGPHETGASAVEKFFYHNALGSHWFWPRAHSTMALPLFDDEPHEIFKHLVTSQNEVVIEAIFEDITDSWIMAKYGVILGTEEFGVINSTATKKKNALPIMNTLVQQLNPSDVTVVLNYRTPRLDQWLSLWKTAAEKSRQYPGQTLCDHDNILWEMIDSSMNPFRLAQAYLDQGWKVSVMDMGGVAASHKDISQVIACRLLPSLRCRNDYWKHHATVPLDPVDRTYGDLTETNLIQVEEMFRGRDCYYQNTLQNNPNFTLHYQSSTWNKCDTTKMDLYEKFVDTDFLYNALRSHKACNAEPFDFNALFGEIKGELPKEYRPTPTPTNKTETTDNVDDGMSPFKDELNDSESLKQRSNTSITLIFGFVICGIALLATVTVLWRRQLKKSNFRKITEKEKAQLESFLHDKDLDNQVSDHNSDREVV